MSFLAKNINERQKCGMAYIDHQISRTVQQAVLVRNVRSCITSRLSPRLPTSPALRYSAVIVARIISTSIMLRGGGDPIAIRRGAVRRRRDAVRTGVARVIVAGVGVLGFADVSSRAGRAATSLAQAERAGLVALWNLLGYCYA